LPPDDNDPERAFLLKWALAGGAEAGVRLDEVETISDNEVYVTGRHVTEAGQNWNYDLQVLKSGTDGSSRSTINPSADPWSRW